MTGSVEKITDGVISEAKKKRSTMVDETDFRKAVELINSSTEVLLTSHTRPDGDACGSVRAMRDSLTHLGKKAQVLFLSPLASWYEFLFDPKAPILGNDITKDQLHAGHFHDCDLVIIIDTNSYVQLPDFDQWLKNAGKKVLVIDHHVTGDALGDVEIIDTTAAATGEIVLDLVKYAGWPLTPPIAEALFVALSTDTGWFRFGNADSRIFHCAAELIDAGARPNLLYGKMYQNFSPQRMKLMIRMLERLELHFDGRVATQCIMRSDFDETGATGPDTESLIDECQRLTSVEVAALFVELADGGFRCSLRSKTDVDVRKIAQTYGGGGHKVAAGVNLPGPFDKAKQIVLTALAKQL
jgi:phosphoesterase RecJ-like protein